MAGCAPEEGPCVEQRWILLAVVVPPGILARTAGTDHRPSARLVYGSWAVVVAAVIVHAFRADAYRVRRGPVPLRVAEVAHRDVVRGRGRSAAGEPVEHVGEVGLDHDGERAVLGDLAHPGERAVVPPVQAG